MPTQNEIRQTITQQILDALKEGTLPWRCPWLNDKNAGFPCNAFSKRRYGGVNPLLLSLHAHRHGFQSKHWGTFPQWEKAGGRVMRRPTDVPKGQWGCRIIFWKPVSTTKTNDGGENVEETYCILRQYTVFNVDQVRGDFDHLRVGHAIPTENHDVVFEQADELIANSGADVRHGGNRALYSPQDDYIQLPFKHQFVGGSYYESAFHEFVHWTQAPQRLNTGVSTTKVEYAFNELVAEIGSCFVCMEQGIPLTETLGNHVSYLKHWLVALQNDHAFIFKASTQASKSADYLLAFAPASVEEPEPIPF
jgi:antirestriction protein ArdC